MAVCKRCGTTFDYNKREGVCPKCCFYNRPVSAWQEDDSWVKKYSYEDNSYAFSTHEADDSGKYSKDHLKDVLFDRDKRFSAPGHKTDKELSGSHVHLDDGRVASPGPGKKPVKPARTPGKGKFGIGSIIVIIIWIYIIISFLIGMVR